MLVQKHIDVDFHFICEKVANGDIQLQHLFTLEQLVDIFTKGHSADCFYYLKDKLMVAGGVKKQDKIVSSEH